jgi:hypothetical protein
MAAVGQARLILGTAPIPHPHFVIQGPTLYPGYLTGTVLQVILVNVTSIRPGRPYDQTCIVRAGEHHAVPHDSWVRYRSAVIEPAAHYDLMSQQNVWKILNDCDAALLLRLQQGLCNSKEAPQFIKTLYGCP